MHILHATFELSSSQELTETKPTTLKSHTKIATKLLTDSGHDFFPYLEFILNSIFIEIT